MSRTFFRPPWPRRFLLRHEFARPPARQAHGKNRHIRRLLAELGIDVLRLVRVAIGRLELGTLAKGEIRHLTPAEVQKLTPRGQPIRRV